MTHYIVLYVLSIYVVQSSPQSIDIQRNNGTDTFEGIPCNNKSHSRTWKNGCKCTDAYETLFASDKNASLGCTENMIIRKSSGML